VLAGSTVIVTYTDASHTAPSFTGTRGEVFTNIKECADVGNSRWIDIYVGTTTTAGQDTITAGATGTHVHTSVHEVVNLLDGSLDVSACGTWSGTNNTSSSITTTKNGDFLLLVIVDNSSLNNIVPAFPTMEASEDTGDIGNHTYWRLAGTNGSYNATWYSDNLAGSYAILGLKSSALAVTTNSVPDAFGGSAYSFQLQATGGSGAYTWSITSGTLQSGLSLSSAGVISGTPSHGGTNTITFKVTDGASATATRTMPVFVGATQGTIAQVQSHRINGSGCAAGGSIGTVTAGNTIMLMAQHVNNTFSLPVFTDTVGTVYYPVQLMLAAASSTIGAGGNITVPYIGIAPASGADTLQCSTSNGATVVAATEFSSVQAIVESAVTAGTIGQAATSSTVTSNNLNIPVSGEMLYSSGIAGPTGNVTSITVQSPFSTGTTSIDAYQLGVTSGNHSASYAIVQTTSVGWGIGLLGLRAGMSGPFSGVRHIVVESRARPSHRLRWPYQFPNIDVSVDSHAGNEGAEGRHVGPAWPGLAIFAHPDRHGAAPLSRVLGPAVRDDDPGH
jgi:hypothetical protein